LDTRPATPDDAPAICATVAEGFAGYLEWAPAGWQPPEMTPTVLGRVRSRLSRDDVWCLIALEHGEVIGHVSLAPTSGEEPEPAPPGVTNLAQMFVRRRRQGTGVAAVLMGEAVAEAARRGFTSMCLWTPRGAARARRFYEREGWTATGAVHDRSPSGLLTMEYARPVPAGHGR
jgi:GNAT superfamily N-acetyltransferase